MNGNGSGISLFVPVLNEEEVLLSNTRRLMDTLRATGRPFEIVIVSNGSTDQTPALGRELAAEDPVIVFEHLAARGPGLALRHALARFRYDHVVTMDVDLSVDPSFIPTADAALDRHVVVLGSKRAGTEHRSWVRRAGSAIFVAAARRLLALPYLDYSIGAKGYQLGFLRSHQGVIDRETGYVLPLVHAARCEGLGVVEIPVDCHDERTSRFNLPYEGVYRFLHLARFWWATRRTGR